MVNDPSWCSVGSSDSCGHCQMNAKIFTCLGFHLYLIKGYEIHKELRYSQVFSSVFICLLIFDLMCLCVCMCLPTSSMENVQISLGKIGNLRISVTQKLAITNFGNTLLSILNLNMT